MDSTNRATEKRIVAELGRLGGQLITEEALRFEGRELILPETMTAEGAIDYLSRYIKTQEEVTMFSRTFNYRPWDGAHALQSALRKLTGTGGIPLAQTGFFGTQPPESRTINVGPNGKVEQVPWGVLQVPLFEGELTTSGEQHPEYGPLFALYVEAPKKYRAHVEGLFKLVEEELNTNSIYRGQAIDGQTMPEFLDLSGVSEDKVIYTDEVMDQLQANVWTLLEHTEKMRELGVPLKRTVLLEGPFGTGKTLGLYLTAQKAVENGWTTIYCRPEKDNLDEVIGLARLYQPSIVLFEDVDTIASVENNDGVSHLLDVFDGINAKGTEILAVMTTNYPEKIHKGMVRPGRLDAVVHIDALDEGGLVRLIEATVPPELLAEDLDHAAIGEAMEGFLPAFAKEAIDRATRYNVSRNGGEVSTLTTEDFVRAATGLRPQLKLMNEAEEFGDKDTVAEAIQPVVEAATAQVLEDAGIL